MESMVGVGRTGAHLNPLIPFSRVPAFGDEAGPVLMGSTSICGAALGIEPDGSGGAIDVTGAASDAAAGGVTSRAPPLAYSPTYSIFEALRRAFRSS